LSHGTRRWALTFAIPGPAPLARRPASRPGQEGYGLSFGGKPSEKSIDLNGTEFLRVPQLIKTYEIADPVPVRLFSTNAVLMQAHHCPDLFTQTGFGGTLHSWLLNCFFTQW